MENVVSVLDCEAYAKARTSGAEDTSFPSRVPTVTEPTGTGVIELRRLGAAARWLSLVPYGVGDDNDVFEMWVVGWRKVVASGLTTLWVPTRLVKLVCTMGAVVGVSGAALADTDRLCDTITATMGVSNVSYQLFSTTDDTPAHALVSTDGCEKVEVIFDMTTGNPTSGNCLYARV